MYNQAVALFNRRGAAALFLGGPSGPVSEGQCVMKVYEKCGGSRSFALLDGFIILGQLKTNLKML